MKPGIKFLFTALLAFGISAAFASTVDRHLSGFKAISLSSSVDVYIAQGASESVKVEAPDDMQSRIITEVVGGTLVIRNKKESSFDWDNWFGSHKKIAVYVSLKDISNIDIAGSGDVFFKEGLNTSTLRLKVSGSGDVTGKLEVKTLESGITGSGDIKLSGHAETSTISISGSGDFTAGNLITKYTTVKVAGSGDAVVHADEKIDAVVAGSGDVRYSGAAKQVSKSIMGSGDIHHM